MRRSFPFTSRLATPFLPGKTRSSVWLFRRRFGGTHAFGLKAPYRTTIRTRQSGWGREINRGGGGPAPRDDTGHHGMLLAW